jgi:hypothetical protein
MPEMVVPEPKAKPAPKTPPKPVEKPLDKSTARKPNAGPEIRLGTPRWRPEARRASSAA